MPPATPLDVGKLVEDEEGVGVLEKDVDVAVPFRAVPEEDGISEPEDIGAVEGREGLVSAVVIVALASDGAGEEDLPTGHSVDRDNELGAAAAVVALAGAVVALSRMLAGALQSTIV